MIAIIDGTGFWLEHPDLDDNYLDRGDEDWYFQTTCPGGIDTCKSPAAGGDFHGTFCAGAAAAELNDSGIIGSCPMCRILPIRFGTTLGDDGESELHDAVYYVRHYVEALGKRAVLSLSFGVSPDTATTFATFFAELDSAYAHGILSVVAVPDRATDAVRGWPCSLPEVLSVTATNRGDSLACYADWGDSVGLDVAAPGGGSVPPYDEHCPCPEPPCDPVSYTDFGFYSTGLSAQPYRWSAGTSFATPLVAGVIGLMLSVNNTLTADSLRSFIESTADKVWADASGIYHYDANGWCPALGHGRVNAFQAVQRALAEPRTSVPAHPAQVLYNGPNPFRAGASTRFAFWAPVACRASLVVYDVRGRQIRRLLDTGVERGIRDISWDGRDDGGTLLSPGVYFVSLTMGDTRHAGKVTIVQ